MEVSLEDRGIVLGNIYNVYIVLAFVISILCFVILLYVMLSLVDFKCEDRWLH